MPGFDKSGPLGEGSMTGRARGMCQRTGEQPMSQLGRGRGRGMGMRCGPTLGLGQQYGRGNWAGPRISQDQADSNMALSQLQQQYQAAMDLAQELKEKIDSTKPRS